MPGHAGVVGHTHVIVGNVDIRVSHSAILQVKSHVLVTLHVPLDGHPLKVGILGGLAEGDSFIHFICIFGTNIHD